MSTRDAWTKPSLTLAEEDERDQKAILSLVIDEHPRQLTLGELARALAPEVADCSVPDWLERGIQELIGWGLLHHAADSVRPSRVALRFQELFY
jgi:hypothetical protein